MSRKRRLTPRKQAAETRWAAAGRTVWVQQRRNRLEATAQSGGWGSLAELLADPGSSHQQVADTLGVSYQYAWRLRRPYQQQHQRRGHSGPADGPGRRPALTAESYARELRDLRAAGEHRSLGLSLAVAHHHAGWRLQTLGDVLGISREAVRQRIAKTIRAIPPPDA